MSSPIFPVGTSVFVKNTPTSSMTSTATILAYAADCSSVEVRWTVAGYKQWIEVSQVLRETGSIDADERRGRGSRNAAVATQGGSTKVGATTDDATRGEREKGAARGGEIAEKDKENPKKKKGENEERRKRKSAAAKEGDSEDKPAKRSKKPAKPKRLSQPPPKSSLANTAEIQVSESPSASRLEFRRPHILSLKTSNKEARSAIPLDYPPPPHRHLSASSNATTNNTTASYTKLGFAVSYGVNPNRWISASGFQNSLHRTRIRGRIKVVLSSDPAEPSSEKDGKSDFSPLLSPPQKTTEETERDENIKNEEVLHPKGAPQWQWSVIHEKYTNMHFNGIASTTQSTAAGPGLSLQAQQADHSTAKYRQFIIQNTEASNGMSPNDVMLAAGCPEIAGDSLVQALASLSIAYDSERGAWENGWRWFPERDTRTGAHRNFFYPPLPCKEVLMAEDVSGFLFRKKAKQEQTGEATSAGSEPTQQVPTQDTERTEGADLLQE